MGLKTFLHMHTDQEFITAWEKTRAKGLVGFVKPWVIPFLLSFILVMAICYAFYITHAAGRWDSLSSLLLEKGRDLSFYFILVMTFSTVFQELRYRRLRKHK